MGAKKNRSQNNDIHKHLFNKGLEFYSNNANGSSMKLMDHKEKLDEYYDYDYLYLSIDQGRDDLVRYLLERNFDPNSSKNGDLIFHLAILNGNEVIVKLFLEHKVDINKTDANGNSALHIAASKGDQIIVKELLNARADCTLRNNKQQTPKELVVNNRPILDLIDNSCNTKPVGNNPTEHNGGISCELINLDYLNGLNELDCGKEISSYMVPLRESDDGKLSLIDKKYLLVLNNAVVATICDEIELREGHYDRTVNNWNEVAQCGEKSFSYIPIICKTRAHGSMLCEQYSSSDNIPLGDIEKMLCDVNKDEVESMPYKKQYSKLESVETAYVLGNVREFKHSCWRC